MQYNVQKVMSFIAYVGCTWFGTSAIMVRQIPGALAVGVTFILLSWLMIYTFWKAN